MRHARCTCSMAATASLSDAPGARLNDMLAAGNCPRWLTTSGVSLSLNFATELSCTWPPLAVVTYMPLSASNPLLKSGPTSSTTRYWLDCVKMVEMSRWLKASYKAASIAAVVMPRRPGSIAVDVDISLEAAILQITSHATELCRFFQQVDQTGHASRQYLAGRRLLR